MRSEIEAAQAVAQHEPQVLKYRVLFEFQRFSGYLKRNKEIRTLKKEKNFICSNHISEVMPSYLDLGLVE